MTNKEHIEKTMEYIGNLPKYRFSTEEVHFCKELQFERIKNIKTYNEKHPTSQITDGKFSRWHSDSELYFGLLCELVVAREIGGKMVEQHLLRSWAEDQMRQNTKILKEGRFDCKDIGHAQIRTAEYNKNSKRNIIYKENDFRTKSCQPLIGCMFNSDSKDLWAVICGFMSYEDLKNRKTEFWSNPDGRGPAMFIPVWELTSMDSFDTQKLL
jgi:hypothetical protein